MKTFELEGLRGAANAISSGDRDLEATMARLQQRLADLKRRLDERIAVGEKANKFDKLAGQVNKEITNMEYRLQQQVRETMSMQLVEQV